MEKNDLIDIMGESCYNIFWNSSTFLAIYDTGDKKILETNNSMKERILGIDFSVLEIILETKLETYLTIQDVPCKIVLVSSISEIIDLVEMIPAHTRRWPQKSDLVYLTDMTSDGVWEWYPELKFEYTSDRFWNVLGYDEKDIAERPQIWEDVVHTGDLAAVNNMRHQHIESRGEIPCISKARYARSDGKEVILLCRAYILDWLPDGRPWRVLGTYTDITEIVTKDALEAKSIFISRMSHEIRSPLCTILNECELLGSKTNTKIITDTCKQLVSITNDVLSLGKLSHAPMKLSVESRDLVEVISSCIKRHRLEARKCGIKIQHIIGDLPDLVDVDPCKFNQVMDNLLTNAIKYSGEGCRITISSDYDIDKELCEISVVDTGVGMTADLQSRAFDEFVQGNDTVQGAGIGLSLAKRLAMFMGGNVAIEQSVVGDGTTMLFTALLPYDKSNTEGSISNMTVLIVDDMTTNRVILKRRLQCLRDMKLVVTDVIEACDGKEAVQRFESYKGSIDLVLMDCHMPIMDGFESTVNIHQSCKELKIPPVPIIAVTASVSAELHDKCLSTGMVGVVTKPYSENDLLFSIVSCIGSRKQ